MVFRKVLQADGQLVDYSIFSSAAVGRLDEIDIMYIDLKLLDHRFWKASVDRFLLRVLVFG